MTNPKENSSKGSGKHLALKVGVLLCVISGLSWAGYHKYNASNSNPSPQRATASHSKTHTASHIQPWQENYAWGQLMDLHRNCQQYWNTPETDGVCSIKKVSQKPYYFSLHPSDRDPNEGIVEIQFIAGDEAGFTATARHEASRVTWSIDPGGQITCSLGSREACERIRHPSPDEVIGEVHRVFGSDVPSDATAVEWQGTADKPVAVFERGR